MWEKSREPGLQACSAIPAAPPPAERPTLDEAEVRALIPLVRENVLDGGIRLARLLDDALGPEAKAPGQRRP